MPRGTPVHNIPFLWASVIISDKLEKAWLGSKPNCDFCGSCPVTFTANYQGNCYLAPLINQKFPNLSRRRKHSSYFMTNNTSEIMHFPSGKATDYTLRLNIPVQNSKSTNAYKLFRGFVKDPNDGSLMERRKQGFMAKYWKMINFCTGEAMCFWLVTGENKNPGW